MISETVPGAVPKALQKLNFIIQQELMTREGASAPSCFLAPVLSGWGYTNACVDNKKKASDPAKDKHKQCGLRAMVYYESDGKDTTEDIEYFYVPFEPQVREQWQFASVAVVPKQPKRPVTKIRILCAFEKNANNCWYDNISLVREASQTMAYDDDGNLQSVTTSGLSVDKSTYKNGNLIKTVTGGYGTFEYTYDTTHKHRLTSVTNGKIQQDMTYDSFGNVTGTTLSQEEGTGKSLQTSAAYDTSGNRLASVTDASGATVAYAYDTEDFAGSEMYGLPTTVTAPNGLKTVTEYDEQGRVTETENRNSLAYLAELQYTYSNGQMSTVTRKDDIYRTQAYNFTYDEFGNMESAKVGNIELASYEYDSNNGLLKKQEYGNEDTLTFTYDDLGRMETATYDDGTVLTYHYNGEGTLHSVTEGDSQGNISRTYLYQYDTLGRLLSCQRLDGNQSVIRTWQHFNEHNQVDQTVWQTANGTYFENYVYDSVDGSLTTIIGSDGHRQALYYDTLSRLTMRTLAGDTSLTERYIYLDGTGNTTTTQVKQKQIYGGPLEVLFEYAYDGSGNIQEEKTTIQGDSRVTTYTYDSQNQLTRENNQAAGKTWVWTYDTVGNILSRKEYAYTTGTLGTVLDTVNYGYANIQWQDLLTNYDGSPVIYDAIGNPLSDGSRTYTWQNGRQLKSLSQSGAQVTFSYDGSGLRTEKTVTGGGTTQTYSYIYSGNTLMEMGLSQSTNGGSSAENRLYFTYDSNGNPATVLTDDGEIYYYVTNLQGDVISILNSSRMPVVQYTYNAWGQVMEVTGSMANTLGQQNPLRYRGYVYDTETALYYLQSRYYDPEMGRFINADIYVSTSQTVMGHNMFAYCGNNPVQNIDTKGEFFFTAIGSLTGFAGSALVATVNNIVTGSNDDIITAGIYGAAGGAIAGAGVDAALVVLGSFGTALPALALAGGIAFTAGGIGNAYTTHLSSNGNASDYDMNVSFWIGGAFNLLSLGLSTGSIAKDLTGVGIAGMQQFDSNMKAGMAISISTGAATTIGTNSPIKGKKLQQNQYNTLY